MPRSLTQFDKDIINDTDIFSKSTISDGLYIIHERVCVCVCVCERADAINPHDPLPPVLWLWLGYECRRKTEALLHVLNALWDSGGPDHSGPG